MFDYNGSETEFEIDKSDVEAFSRPFKIAKISIKKIFKKSVYEHYEKQLTEKLSLINDSSIVDNISFK